MSTWLINGLSPETLGLAVAGGEWRSGGPSSVRLTKVTPFDGTQTFAHNAAISITRDGAPYFKGTVRSVPKFASDSDESHSYVIQDAWALLEKTTYQEPWKDTASTTVMLPTVVLGMSSAGIAISLGAQIAEVIAFAASCGIEIQCGSMPTGMLLWPTKATGVTCADVIRTSLKSHPDWIPWIDHTTTPPTFNVTPASAATARSLSITDARRINITETSERVPDSVRIVYLTASESSEEIFRTGAIDQYPAGSDRGPGVLTTIVQLAGTQAQFQKQQIQTRAFPDDQASAKAYLKSKYPFIKDIPDSHFNVTTWDKAVVPDPEPKPDLINPNATRLIGTTSTHLPRELVRGSVEPWMRCRIGKVSLKFTVYPATTATQDEIELLNALPTIPVIVTATNAVTKIYQGLSNWTAPEDIPIGIAEAYYNTLANGCMFEGSVTLIEDEIGAVQWHGHKLNLTGGATAWAGMNAPIHNVDWDLDTRETTISFGPNPDYSVPDFMEYLKLLAHRTPYWMSGNERTSHKLGYAAGPSSQGDSVSPFDTADTVTPPPPVTSASGPWCGVRYGAAACKIKNASLLSKPDATTAETIVAIDDAIDLTATTKVWLEIPFGASWPAIDTSGGGASIQSGTDWFGSTSEKAVKFDTSTPPKQSRARVKIGQVNTGRLPAGRKGFNFQSSTGTDLHWEQLLTHNLCLFSCAVSGKAAMLPRSVGA